MESSDPVVNEENCAKPHLEDVSKGDLIETEAKSKDANIERREKDAPRVEDEDVELSEVEASKDFGGNIDEDELLKDTEGEEGCNIVTDSSGTENAPLSEKESQDDLDSTDDKCKKSSEDEVKENLNTGDGVPDSSNENLKDTQIDESFSLSLTEENEGNECTNNEKVTELGESVSNDGNECTNNEKDTELGESVSNEGNECINNEKDTEQGESVSNTSKDGETCESDTAVTSSNAEQIEKNSRLSHCSTDTINEVSENSNSVSHEIENDTLITESKTNTSKTETESVRLNIEDESNENTNLDEIDNQNKSNSCDGTKFVHVEQENSRPEESFESMETGGEDPFAQTSDVAMETSDVAMDTTESNEKERDVEKLDEPMEISEGEKSDVRVDISEDVEKDKDKEIPHTNNVEDISEKTINEAEVKSVVNIPNENGTNLTRTEKVPQEIDLESHSEADKKSDEGVEESRGGNDATRPTQEDGTEKRANNEKDIITMTPVQKLKAGRTPGPRSRRKSSSEDSNSDIDIEELKSIDPVPKRTPKRNAAKKAESQIKVLSQLDKEMKERINEEAAVNVINYKKPDDPSYNATDDVNMTSEYDVQTCFTCKKVGPCSVNVLTYGKTNHFCNNDCFVTFRDGPVLKPGEGGEIIPPSTVMSQLKSAIIQPMDRAEFVRKCSQCSAVINGDDEKTLSWETMDFCIEECLGKYQQELGSHCANCKGNVQQASLGKYCVRFGYEVKQFCCSTCLEEFKKGLKVCSFCQKDISSGAEGFLAPVGDKGTFKDFCTPACMEKYEQMSSNQPPPQQVQVCDVCAQSKPVEFEVVFDNKLNKLCSDICFKAYKFANTLTADRCDMCKKYFDKDAEGEKFNIFYEGIPHNFCCKTCMNVYILAKRKIVPCNWCKVKKYNFDMIKRVQNSGQVLMMCSLNCLTLYQVSVNAVSSKRIKCDMCNSVAQAQYHLTMSDATIRNFCTYPCVMNFQQQYSKSPITLPGSGDGPPIPTGTPKRVVPKNDAGVPVPVISSVTSLANGQPASTTSPAAKPTGKLNLVARLCEPPVSRNKFTQTRPIMNTKSVSCRPHSNAVETQTEAGFGSAVIPIPVPIYVPCPMAMYSMPFPVPVPFPLPIPVPIFLPTTRNSIKGIMKEIKRIMEKVPEDPLEAELLMMADMVAEDKTKTKDSSDSEPDDDNDNDAAPSPPNSDAEGDDEGGGSGGGGEGEEREMASEGEPAENSNTGFSGDDIVQMALSAIGTDLDTPAADDLETHLPSSNIQPTENSTDGNSSDTVKRETRGRKRAAPASRTPSRRNTSSEPKKRKSQHNSDTPSPAPAVDEPKPDANMKLKFTFGVNAWKSWVTVKNAEIEMLNSTGGKKMKPFKTDLLQLSTDELNFSLCLFIKEVKKPNGTPYAPDTIYYLCLGIQLYLFENGRIDNIFTDPYFETFTDALDDVAKKFSELFNDHHYIVTRVEEEHLWESKQLGAHSPHVLLSTLMFFNTKHFNLTNVDEHLLLSFSHIMKHWKRNINQSGSSTGRAPGSRNVLLRFYPPQSLIDDPNLKKKKVYEQQENEENPLRCPVKLYEFYLSKCPESVKNRNDVFYLQPERSCVPDSPVWYSTMALQREPLEKMLNRVKMVKEINIALLVP